MLKDISWDTKEKIKISLILFFALLSKSFFESIENGYVEPVDIILQIAACLAFTAFLITTLTDRGLNLKSAQGVLAVIMVIITLGIVISYRLISEEMLYSVLFSSVMIMLAQKLYLLPVAALLGFAVSLAESMPEIHSIAISGIPAAVGVSLVYLSDKIKNSALWKKIVFVGIELFMVYTVVSVLETKTGMMTFHNVKTQMWDSVASLAAIIILVALAIFSIVNKRTAGEALGYIAAAVFGVLPITMEMEYAFVSAMSMFMMLVAVAKDGMTADMFFEKTVESVRAKIKKKA